MSILNLSKLIIKFNVQITYILGKFLHKVYSVVWLGYIVVCKSEISTKMLNHPLINNKHFEKFSLSNWNSLKKLYKRLYNISIEWKNIIWYFLKLLLSF